jgi:DME family drug/metabolite transporter
MTDHQKGILYALAAAALNATIGVLTKTLVALGFAPSSIAGLKTVIGFVILLGIVLVQAPRLLRGSWLQAGLCAFFGIFVLFHFETAAYAHQSAANVVVMLMACAAFSAMALGWPVLGDRPRRRQVLGLLVAVVGVALICGASLGGDLHGLLLAAIAGTGYGIFSVLVKKLGLQGGFALTTRLLFFGSLYLGIAIQPDNLAQAQWSATAVLLLVLLAVFPTVLGFVCTTRAIQHISPGRVQTLELAEPVFAAVFALALLGEVPSNGALAGGAVVMLGLYLSAS